MTRKRPARPQEPTQAKDAITVTPENLPAAILEAHHAAVAAFAKTLDHAKRAGDLLLIASLNTASMGSGCRG